MPHRSLRSALFAWMACTAACRLTPFENGVPDDPTVEAVGRVLVGEEPAVVARDLAAEEHPFGYQASESEVAPPRRAPMSLGGGPTNAPSTGAGATAATPTGATSTGSSDTATNTRPPDAPPPRPRDAPPPRPPRPPQAPPPVTASSGPASAAPATAEATPTGQNTPSTASEGVAALNAAATAAATAAPSSTEAPTPGTESVATNTPTAPEATATEGVANGAMPVRRSVPAATPSNAQTSAANTPPAPANATPAATTPGSEPWRNRGPTATPYGSATGTPPSGATSATAAAEQPTRDVPFDLVSRDAVTRVVPPAHPGPQPLLIAFDGSCTPAPPACDLDDETGRAYGWAVCTKPRASCDGTETPPNAPDSQGAALDAPSVRETVRRIQDENADSFTRENGLVIARGAQASALLTSPVVPGQRYPYAVLVEPAALQHALAATLPFTRIAWIQPARSRGAGTIPPDVLRELTERHVEVAWFTPRSNDARTRAQVMLRAVAWARAGDDAGVCPAAGERSVERVRREVRVGCNEVSGPGG